ncbi:unnamed protein product [Peniophora sp. CBMAI 1063]|nr:unnamed protein product [Peniophora sp. CBMAI 1063]
MTAPPIQQPPSAPQHLVQPQSSGLHPHQDMPWRKAPLEVLIHVFSFVVDAEPPYRSHGPPDAQFTHPPIGWLRLGHINSVWRRALLGNASFWAKSIGVYARAMHEMLMRAGPSALLRVELPFSHGLPTESGLAELLQACRDDQVALLNRLQALIIENDVNPAGPELEEASTLFTSPLPELQELELSFSHFSEPYKKDLNKTLDAPKLQKISLLNCCFTGVWLAPALASLQIVMRRRPMYQWIASPEYILGVLDACKHTLRRVHLENVFWDDRPAEELRIATRTDRVYLPHLTSLYLSDFAGEAAVFLTGLALPPTARAKVEVSKHRLRSDQAGTTVFQELVRAALGEHPGRFNALRMHDDDRDPTNPDDGFDIDLYELPSETKEHHCAWFAGLQPAVSFHIECDGSPYLIYPYIRDDFTEDILVPVLSEHVPDIQKLAFALGEVQNFEDEGEPESHVGHIMDYAAGATTVAIEDPYAYGCPVMGAFSEWERLSCVDTLCILYRVRDKGKKVDSWGLSNDLGKRASTIPTVHIDQA